MYRIIGGDEKEYGPISAEDVRRWIREGRLNSQSQARAEDSGEWKALRLFPEFADALGIPSDPAGASSSPPTNPAPPWSADALVEKDYELDIGNCISRSWNLVQANFWPVVGILVLIWAAESVVSQGFMMLFVPKLSFHPGEVPEISAGQVYGIIAFVILMAPVQTILNAGLFNYYLKLIRNEHPQVSDAFASFSPIAGPLALLSLVNMILTLLGYAFCILPGIYLSVAWVFALPLVIDRRLGFWQAMELSRRVVSRHWFIAFAFLLVIGLVTASGLLACCIGVVLTVPISFIALLYAYEDLFGRRTG